ncbi:hypothetical protein K469DRAFT_689762 [Zopfia rhizophila CBS 207.26]|uniref:Uncharacterized protein n=1 Tax=Zopfia rhizophila CBS 207.26 TaxID=1314779 RepID=A0A6A6DZ99_9PEZI|nr:hypothetical protein K469DRAFT_689762 [Zopfia rhizophila CBS 207.26]
MRLLSARKKKETKSQKPNTHPKNSTNTTIPPQSHQTALVTAEAGRQTTPTIKTKTNTTYQPNTAEQTPSRDAKQRGPQEKDDDNQPTKPAAKPQKNNNRTPQQQNHQQQPPLNSHTPQQQHKKKHTPEYIAPGHSKAAIHTETTNETKPGRTNNKGKRGKGPQAQGKEEKRRRTQNDTKKKKKSDDAQAETTSQTAPPKWTPEPQKEENQRKRTRQKLPTKTHTSPSTKPQNSSEEQSREKNEKPRSRGPTTNHRPRGENITNHKQRGNTLKQNITQQRQKYQDL